MGLGKKRASRNAAAFPLPAQAASIGLSYSQLIAVIIQASLKRQV